MFGYVVANREELKIREYRRYQSFYCGVCKSLKNRYGFVSRMTLSYDMTFLALVLSALYEDTTQAKKVHCIAHPATRHEALTNAFTDYAAAMNVLLSYYKCRDDWEDEKKLTKKTVSDLLRRAFKKACRDYPAQARAVEEYIRRQKEAEDRQETDLDAVAGITGDMLGRLFVLKEDMWQENLYRMGYYLGKFIYIMDAYDDIPKDIRKSNYNPLIAHREEEGFDNRVKEMLTLVAAESAKAFEKLPILEDAEIIRNIIYSGIWTRYDGILAERHKVTE